MCIDLLHNDSYTVIAVGYCLLNHHTVSYIHVSLQRGREEEGEGEKRWSKRKPSMFSRGLRFYSSIWLCWWSRKDLETLSCMCMYVRCTAKAQLESSERVGVIRGPAESLLERLSVVLLVIGPGRIRRERSSDRLRDRGWRGNMRALRVEAVLVGRVLDSDRGAIGRGIRISTLHHLFDGEINIWMCHHQRSDCLQIKLTSINVCEVCDDN